MTDDNNTLKLQKYRQEAVSNLCRWIGTPYIWGGDDFSAFDCSGLIVEVLKSVGLLKERQDFTAEGLFHLFADDGLIDDFPHAGCLIFWFNSLQNRAVHVAMMKDELFLVHASGGGQNIKNIQDAIRNNAFVKSREFEQVAEFRKKEYAQSYKAVDPFK